MYLNHFSLKIRPFQITVDPKFLWLGEKHKEALATLRYGIIDNRGFLLMTGEVGTGKTILINRLISLLDIDTVVATLPDPDLESMDFYNLLADGLKMKRTFDTKGEFLIHLRDFLHQSYVNQKQVLLIIDESQRLNHRLMEDIRVLSNIELHDRKLINIFFVGQQEFNSILMTPQNRALSQRITVRYHIEALNASEVGEYIRHRLKVAGCTKRIFEPTAVSEIYQVSGGIPRLINIICDHAMLTAYAQGVHKINGKIINECAEELRIPIQKPQAGAATVKSPGHHPVDQNAADRLDPKRDAAPGIGGFPKQDASAGEVSSPKSSSIWHLAYAAAIILLVGAIALLIGEYTINRTPRYAEEDLTPQKYKSTLEQEKALLEDRLNNGGVKNDNPTPTSELPAKTQSSDPVMVQPDLPAARPQDPAEAIDETVKTIEPLPLLKSKVTIPFTINSNAIDEDSYQVLDQIATHLLNHPEMTIGVKGYTDDSGARSYNESVSGFRASAVQSYLIGKGVDPQKISVFAMGSANPIASNNSISGRRRNRRVEIEFYTPKTSDN
jgi:general secretion pathway protein A